MASSFILFSWLALLVLCGAMGPGALAQNQTNFDTLMTVLDQLGYTNFTAIARQVNADPGQLTFATSLSDPSKPHTLFVPNNNAFANPSVNFYGYTYQPDDTVFLSALLLYHLAPGNWTQQTVGNGSNHTIFPTTLQGHNLTALENDTPQVLACGVGSNGLEIYNQVQTTAVVNTYTYGSLTINEVNEVIGLPGSYTFLTKFYGLSELEALRVAAGVPTLDTAHGFTLFAPLNPSFDAVKSNLAGLSPKDVFTNHVVQGRTIWSPEFGTEPATSSSGLNYSFAIDSNGGTKVTLNGITANLIRTDFLTANGVVHIVDQVFYNTTVPVALAVTGSSTSSSAPQSTGETSTGTGASPSPTNSSGAAPPGTQRAGSLSVGAIVGIVCVGLAVLSIPVVAFFLRRYHRRAGQGTRVRRASHFSAFDPPSPTPWYDQMSMVDGPFGGNLKMPLPPFPPRVRTSAEKSPALWETIASGAPAANGQAGALRHGVAPPDGGLPALAPEVVDHIVQQVSRRIDRVPDAPPGIAPSGDAPPLYRSPSRAPSAFRRNDMV